MWGTVFSLQGPLPRLYWGHCNRPRRDCESGLREYERRHQVKWKLRLLSLSEIDWIEYLPCCGAVSTLVGSTVFEGGRGASSLVEEDMMIWWSGIESQ